MSYSIDVDQRILKETSSWKGTSSKKMFGGICHLLDGKMFSGVYKDFLILRLPRETADLLFASGDARPFDITGRPMKGWVMMEANAIPSDERLRELLEMARAHVRTLPDK